MTTSLTSRASSSWSPCHPISTAVCSTQRRASRGSSGFVGQPLRACPAATTASGWRGAVIDGCEKIGHDRPPLLGNLRGESRGGSQYRVATTRRRPSRRCLRLTQCPIRANLHEARQKAVTLMCSLGLPVGVSCLRGGRELRRLWRAGQGGAGMDGEPDGGERLLVEVELGGEVCPRMGTSSRTVGPRVGAAVGAGVEALATEKVVLDELVVGVEARGSGGRSSARRA